MTSKRCPDTGQNGTKRDIFGSAPCPETGHPGGIYTRRVYTPAGPVSGAGHFRRRKKPHSGIHPDAALALAVAPQMRGER